MSGLKDALGRGTEVTFRGQKLMIEALDFNDLLELEEFTGVDSDDLDMTEFLAEKKNRRFYLWLVLRKADPELTDEERDLGQYRMTETEAGRLIPFDSTVEQFALINASMGVSGLVQDTTDPKPEPAKKPARRAKIEVPAESAPAA